MNAKQRGAVRFLINFFKYKNKAVFILEELRFRQSLTKTEALDIWYEESGENESDNYFTDPFNLLLRKNLVNKQESFENVRAFRYWETDRLKRFSKSFWRFVDEVSEIFGGEEK